MNKTSFLCFWLACLIVFSLHPATAHAVYLGSAYKMPPGYGLTLYPTYYAADIRTDKDGNTADKGLGLRKYGIAAKSAYQIGDFQFMAIIPVNRVEIDKIKQHDTGIGDLQLVAGWFLPVEWANILPAVSVKVPVGSYDRNRKVNVGDGQTDLAVGAFIFKLMEPFTFDASLKYNIRFRNSATDVTPGNEFAAEGLATLRTIGALRVGPGVTFCMGADNGKAGNMLADSGLLRLAAGGEIFYGKLEHVKASLSFYRDILTRNSFEGYSVLGRIIFIF